MDGRIDKIAELLMLAGADPNQRDRFGATPLYDAIQDNKMKYMRKALDRGGDLGIPDQDGFSPLSPSSPCRPYYACSRYEIPKKESWDQSATGRKNSASYRRRTGRKVARYCNRRCQGQEHAHLPISACVSPI